MRVIRSAAARRTSTPLAHMTTLASPTQGNAATALWRVDMAPGATGPHHTFDVEQIWTVISGGATVVAGDASSNLGAGDTFVLPADLPRRIHSDPVHGFVAIVTAPAGARAYNPNDVTPADACDGAPRAAERLVPAWIA